MVHQNLRPSRIKPCDTANEQESESWTPGRLRQACVTAERLILLAYISNPDGEPRPRGVSMQDVIVGSGASVQNGPSWLGSRRFTLQAKASSSAGLEMMLGPLMKGVLADRFGLRVHEESRPMQVYELVQDSHGAKLSGAGRELFSNGRDEGTSAARRREGSDAYLWWILSVPERWS